MNSTFETRAMIALLESGSEKADQKIHARKNGGNELKIFSHMMIASLKAGRGFRASTPDIITQIGRVSLNNQPWILQGLASDFFWTYRRMCNGQYRAEQQAMASVESTEASIAEFMADLVANGGLDPELVRDVHGDEVGESVATLGEMEDALVALHEALNDVYIQLPNTQYDQLPFTSRGAQVATSVEGAFSLADLIIAEANDRQNAVNRSIIRSIQLSD